MKSTKPLLLTGGFLCLLLLFQSCSKDDSENSFWPNALVTVKMVDDNSVYLQLDDKTTLLPVNLTATPFNSKEVRALVNYKEVDKPSGVYNKAVHVNWIDTIRTKPMVPDLGEKNDAVYGNDPVEIVNDWVTIVEDGYLTLRFRTLWGGDRGKVHYINLVESPDPENPYEIEFRHDAAGDLYGRPGDALVAFKLDKLPDTEGKTVKLKLKWNSFSGKKSVEFDYNSSASSPLQPAVALGRSELNVK